MQDKRNDDVFKDSNDAVRNSTHLKERLSITEDEKIIAEMCLAARAKKVEINFSSKLQSAPSIFCYKASLVSCKRASLHHCTIMLW